MLFITACGISGNNKSGSIPYEDAFSWQEKGHQLEKRYVLALETGCNIYGCYVKDNGVFLDSINGENFLVKETVVLPGAVLISGMAADQEGNVYILDNRGESAGIWKVDADGCLQDYVSMSLESTENADDLFLKGVYTDQNGYLYVWCEMMVPEEKMVEDKLMEVWHYIDRVYIKDGQLNTIFYDEIPSVSGKEVLDFQVNENGSPIFIVKDQDGIYMQEIDVEKGKPKDEVRLKKTEGIFETDYADSLENIVSIRDGFLFSKNNELFEYHYDTQEVKRLLNLSNYGILYSDILFLTKKGDIVEIIDNHGETDCSEFFSFMPGKSGKKVVTLGMTMAAQDLEKVVAEFNRYNGDYRVEMVDYFGQTGDYDKAVEQINLDVVTGTAPDVISVSGIDYSMLSEKGVFADLYGFMENDEECSKDAFVQSVVEAYEDGGRLYSIAPAFQLHSMWGYGDVIGGRRGVTFEGLFQILENSGKDLNAIAGFSGDEPVLTRLCTVAMDEFIDWDNGTCNFEGEYFKKLLSFAKEYTGNYTGGTYLQRIKSREVIMSVGIISSVFDYQVEKELYGTGVAFIGYPVAEGTGTVIAFRGSAVAINAKIENQEGAWEFVKFYLLHGYDGQGFPVVQEQFDRILNASMEEEYFITEQGATERKPKGVSPVGDDNIVIYAAAQEDVDLVRELVESADNRFEPHPAIQTIINEEAEGYFSGQIDLEKTAEKIQNRVTLLLQESH